MLARAWPSVWAPRPSQRALVPAWVRAVSAGAAAPALAPASPRPVSPAWHRVAAGWDWGELRGLPVRLSRVGPPPASPPARVGRTIWADRRSGGCRETRAAPPTTLFRGWTFRRAARPEPRLFASEPALQSLRSSAPNERLFSALDRRPRRSIGRCSAGRRLAGCSCRGYGNQRHLAKPRRRDQTHHFRHAAVIDALVAPNVEQRIGIAAGDRLQAWYQRLGRYFRLLDEDPAFTIDRDDERLLRLGDRRRLGLRQLDRHSHRQQRRRDHED